MAKSMELTSPEIAERISIAGLPDECAEKLQGEITSTGINHPILAISGRPVRRHPAAADPRPGDACVRVGAVWGYVPSCRRWDG